MKIGIAVLLLGLLVAPAQAQIVAKPAPPLDSARASLRDALLVLRDSLATIDAAASRLQRDYREASGASLLSRAKVMRAACARSVRAVGPTRAAVLGSKLSTPLRQRRQAELVAALDTLNGVLARCDTEFAAMGKPDQGETVRGYGNDRAVRVLNSVRRYEQNVRTFLGVMGIKVVPLGVTPPAAGG